MKWFRKTKAHVPQPAITWQTVIDAGNRCSSDIDLINRTELLSDAEKEALRNDALDVFAAVFTSYIRR